MGSKNRCIDNLGGWSPPARIGMYSCHGQGGSQVSLDILNAIPDVALLEIVNCYR